MKSPHYRTDVNGVIPQLAQTVKDICDYLPSMRLESHTSQISEHRFGTIIETKRSTDAYGLQTGR